uniref:Reverse transcriptase domain-containing protein n=1 Tax=Leptobrachium leishanense TaxID=445787 RepID=A0A8C5MGY3_9ANUR
MSRQEYKALQDLHENKAIILKSADKGGAIVIMNKVDYIKEVERQLQDRGTYLVSDFDTVLKRDKEIDLMLKEALEAGVIDVDLHQYLKKEYGILPVFYVLPKVHKSLINPPGRPIVASSDSVLQPISIFLDRILQPLVLKTRSFIWDSKDVLHRLESLSLDRPVILFTWDVTSLYTSIPNEDGLRAINEALRENAFSEIQIAFLLKLVQFVLCNNLFLFGDTVYRQCRGTTMGSNMAPAYANLFMDAFEKNFVYSHPFFARFVHVWWRYIDDVFGIWLGNLEDLETFFKDINGVSEHIKFTMTHSRERIDFLDLTLIIEGERLSSDLFTKPTDRNSLLHFRSFHPANTLRSLPRSQLLRVVRNVSDPGVRKDRLESMVNKFKTRGYPATLLRGELHRVESFDRMTMISRRTPKHRHKTRIPFVSKFSQVSGRINNVIRRHWGILHKAYKEIPFFLDPPIFAYKRNRNLRDHLIKADIGPLKVKQQKFLGIPKKGTFPCLGCSSCNAVIKGDFLLHPHTGDKIWIRDFYTCESSYVVYILKCPCGLLYVGETTTKMKERFSKHKSTIRTGRYDLPVPEHFFALAHNIAQLRFQIIDHVPVSRRGGDRIKLLKQKEKRWIHRLDTLWPRGLNREFDLHHCY